MDGTEPASAPKTKKRIRHTPGPLPTMSRFRPRPKEHSDNRMSADPLDYRHAGQSGLSGSRRWPGPILPVVREERCAMLIKGNIHRRAERQNGEP